jgi:glyoxylate reductase
MQPEKVFVTRQIPEKGIEMLRKEYSVEIWLGDMPPAPEELLKKVTGAAGILSLLTDKIDAAVMEAAGDGLKVISNYAVGYDNIDIPEATRRRIAVGNTPGVLTEATADHTFALLMAAARRVAEGDRQVRAGGWRTWEPMGLLGADIHGATLGLVGFGRIGQAMARRAAGFEMRVLYYDPEYQAKDTAPGNAVYSSFEQVLSESDFISIHVPLTDQTRRMFNQENFNKMKTDAILINTSRGGVVDQGALFDALKNGKLAAAGIDVTDPEPLPLDSPLLTLENLVITPHIASASRTTRERMAVMAAENLLAGIKGEKLTNCVNPQIYQK